MLASMFESEAALLSWTNQPKVDNQSNLLWLEVSCYL